MKKRIYKTIQYIQLRGFSSYYDPYKVLQVPRNCSPQQAKDSFRRLAQLYHPDGKFGDATKFNDIKHAYDEIMAEIGTQSIAPQEETQSKEKEDQFERIRQKLYQEGEKIRQQRRLKKEQEEREEMERLQRNQRMREEEYKKHRDYERMMNEYRRKRHEAMMAQVKSHVKKGYDPLEYDEKEARKVFDDAAQKMKQELKEQKIEFEIKEKLRMEEMERQRQEKIQFQQMLLQKKIQENTYQPSLIIEKIQEVQKEREGIDKRKTMIIAIIGGIGILILLIIQSQLQQKQVKIQEEIEQINQKNKIELDKMISEQLEFANADMMKTIVLIPIYPAPKDPDWVIKRQLGQKLNPQELKDYCQYHFEKEKRDFHKRNIRTPNANFLFSILQKYQEKKKQCFMDWYCLGLDQTTYGGSFGRCGKMEPFQIWDQFIASNNFQKELEFMNDHYNIPPFVYPEKAEMFVNAFFQAKYGLYYCFDSPNKFGIVKFDPFLIAKFEREKLRKTWNTVMLFAIGSSIITWDDLEPYEIKDYRKSKSWYQKQKSKLNIDSIQLNKPPI